MRNAPGGWLGQGIVNSCLLIWFPLPHPSTDVWLKGNGTIAVLSKIQNSRHPWTKCRSGGNSCDIMWQDLSTLQTRVHGLEERVALDVMFLSGWGRVWVVHRQPSTHAAVCSSRQNVINCTRQSVVVDNRTMSDSRYQIIDLWRDASLSISNYWYKRTVLGARQDIIDFMGQCESLDTTSMAVSSENSSWKYVESNYCLCSEMSLFRWLHLQYEKVNTFPWLGS